MSWITVIWSAASGACVMLALMHLAVWCRDRRSWANLCIALTVLGVLGLAVCEMITMRTESPEVFGHTIRWTHLVYAIGVIGSLGFVHFYFGTGRKWLLALAIGLRVLLQVPNFTTGMNLHIASIQSLQKINFLGEQVSILGEWVTNPWVLLGWIASLVQLVYVVDASVRLWRTGSLQSRRRALMIGGTLVFFVIFTVANAGLVAAGVLRLPFVTSLSFFGLLLVMGNELSRDLLRAAQLAGKLRESEERLNLAADSAGAGLWSWDFKTNLIWATERARKLYGFSVDEPISFEKFLSRLHAEDRAWVVEAARKGAREGAGFHYDYRVVLPDGSSRWLNVQAKVVLTPMGKPERMTGVALDITERKKSEENARNAQELMSAVFNSVPGLLYLYTEDRRLIQWNKQHEEMTGYSSAELLNFRAEDWFDEEHWVETAKTVARVFSEGYAQNELTMTLKDGQQKQIFATGSRVMIDGKPHMVGIAIDISMRKKAEESLRESEARYRGIFEGAIEGMYRSSLQGEFLAANPALAKMLGYDSPDHLVRTVKDLAAELWADPTERSRFVRMLEERGVVRAYECQFKRRDGAGIWVAISSRVVREPTGRLAYFEGFIEDITERKRSELEIAQQRNQLTHLSRVNMLGELAGSLAHELNQPLTAVLSNAQAAQRFLAHDQPDLNEVREILADIVAEDKRAGEVIRRLRLLLKTGEVQNQPLNVNEVVQEVLKLVRSDLVNHNFTAQTELAPHLPLIHGDRVQLQQVLLNLVMNACDAMAGAGRGHRQLTIRSCRADDLSIHISVVDCGGGIDPEKLEQVFEPFFTTKPHGLGLGLAVCRTIITAHGGKLWATNNPERGATFHVALPAAVKKEHA